MTLLVPFISGPGAGKSTTAALVFAALKERGHNAEFVPEVAKAATWEGHDFAIRHQVSLMGQQMRAWDRVDGKVDIAVTDTSTLLSLIYPDDSMDERTQHDWREFILSDWRRRDPLLIHLHRNARRPYNPAGRIQTEEEAICLDKSVMQLLALQNITHRNVTVHRPASVHVAEIVSMIEQRLYPLATRHHHLLNT